MRAPWCPFAERTEYDQFQTGAFRDAEHRKAVWHKTQGGGVLNWYNTSGGIPHFTILATGVLHQHYSCNRYSRALRNLRGGVETNTDGAIQVEIEGFSGEDVTDAQRVTITQLAAWLTDESHVEPAFPMGRLSKPYRVATADEWDNGKGHFAHGQIPEQDHTDPDMTDSTWQALLDGVTGGADPVAVSPQIDRQLRRGDSGPKVKNWQRTLMAMGFELPKSGADSEFGEETEDATKLSEVAMGLAPDGVVSVEQARLAMNVVAQRQQTPTPAPVPVLSDTDMARGHIVGALEDVNQIRARLTAALAALD